ncbi:MAG: sulfatase-like hydrolase/transferase [Planctomycetes bacterium]|nr:sulfatase-like hydrolase/transferase [Planctomycetota bacterium]
MYQSESGGSSGAGAPKATGTGSAATSITCPATPAAPQSTFWLCCWLAVLLVATKAVHLGLPGEFTIGGLAEYARDLAVISHADVLFALCVGLVGQGALAASARRPRLETAVWVVLVLFCLTSAVYAIVSVQIFAYLRTPLTYPLIYLAGDMKNMRSSLEAFVSLPLVMALVGGPALYLCLVWATDRLVQLRHSGWLRLGQGIGLVGILGYGLLARQAAVAGPWSDRDDRRIAENPHWVLVSSFLTELGGGQTVRLNEEFPSEYLADFKTVDQRPGGAPPTVELRRRPTNVIIVVLESVGAQYLSLYGSSYETTPRLRAEAAHGLVFDNFYCHVGLTANSLVALTLSIYPGMTWREYTVEQPDLPGTTLADVLRARGYRTAFISSGDNEYVNQDRFLENRGFHEVWDYRQLGCGPKLFSWGVEDRCMVDGVLRWIDQTRLAPQPSRTDFPSVRDGLENRPTQPFFVLAWTQQTHHPYEFSPAQKELDFFQGDPPPGDDYNLARYLNILLEVDRQLGRLFDGLRERDLAEETLVVVTGDHGEAFGSPHRTYGHGGKIFQENVRVPFMLWNPPLFRGERRQTVGGHVDLNPTVLDVLGIPAADSWQGRSLFDPSHPSRAYFYAANDDYLLGVREKNWKYQFNATLGRDELFDLGRDPNEQTNLAEGEPQRCRDLRQRLAAWVDYQQRHIARLQQHGAAVLAQSEQ